MDHDERQTMAEVAERLRAKFPGVGSLVIDHLVEEEYHSLDGAPIRSFVGILVEKQARDALESTAA